MEKTKLKGTNNMGNKQTCSVSHGRCAAKHTARKFVPKNVYEEMMPENIHLIYQPVKEAFHEAFDDAIQEYNSRQKRADRKKHDYYQEIVDGQYEVDENGKKRQIMNAPHPEYEYVFQYGNRDTNPASVLDDAGKRVLGPYANVSREALLKFFEEFKKANPNLFITGASIHMDEATPHLHIRFIPVATGYKNGMKKRCSLTKALENLGFERSPGREKELSISKWTTAQNAILEEIGQEYGFEIIEGNSKGRKHVDVREWCAGKGDEITQLEKETAALQMMAEHEEARAFEAHQEANKIVASCAEQIKMAEASMQTTLQNKAEYDNEITALKGPDSPIRRFYDAIYNFVQVVKKSNSKAEI
ncbi:MAG: plasmid recombination protein, partial [Elusimicrobiaceae bacterium]|nr:plasmid recombination protein [Elusimicrobiaceae bacterium]